MDDFRSEHARRRMERVGLLHDCTSYRPRNSLYYRLRIRPGVRAPMTFWRWLNSDSRTAVVALAKGAIVGAIYASPIWLYVIYRSCR
jgi:hypothetical protein